MLILGEKANGTNILHIIIGPETEMQFNFQGQSVMDISEYIASYQTGDKCMVVINRCESEEEVIRMMEYQKTKMNLIDVVDQVQKKIMSQENSSASQKKPAESKPEKQSNVKCPSCLKENSAIVKNGTVFPCEICQKIDAGLKSSKIPPLPSGQNLEQIRKQVEQDNQEQKKSIFKLYKKNDDKDKKDKK